MAAKFHVAFSPAAERQLQKLPATVRGRIMAETDRLEENPRHSGVKKLSGEHEIYRVRVGDYRILFEIEDDKLVILVVRIAHRKDAYRGM